MTLYTDEEIFSMPIEKLSHAIKDKVVSPVDVVNLMLNRIEKYNPVINAFITVNHRDAMERARLLEKELSEGTYRGPLHGIPIGLKDLIFTKTMKTTMGSALFKDYIPDDNATVVEKLEAAGAIIIGKLNTHQFAYGTTGDRSYFGPVKNPHHLSKISGGSSSGSAAAVSLNLCYAALGTDTSGSVRIPASCCGVVGMKPTFGSISKYGVFPLSAELDHIGILSKTPKDNAILLNGLIGYDEKDPYSLKADIADDLTQIDFDSNHLMGKTIGIPTSYFYDHLDPVVSSAFNDLKLKYKALGIKFKEIVIKDIEKYVNAQQTILKKDAWEVHKERLKNESDNDWDAEVKERLLLGEAVTFEDYDEALAIREEAIDTFNKMFNSVDVIVTPTLPILPTDIGQRRVRIPGFEEENVRWALSRLTAIVNLIGFPSISVPVDKPESSLPIGYQIIGKPNDEVTVYQFAHWGQRKN